MKLRSHFLNALVNKEVEAYLETSDVILVPFGPTELHGGMPLDCETVVSEGLALVLAEEANCLILPNLPYIYSGATASAVGTIQLTVRESSDLMYGIAKSLLQSGFKKQVYFSLHGPAHISIQPVIRDFFDETGVGLLYVDVMMAARKSGVFDDPTQLLANFDKMICGAYKLRKRLEDVPLTTDFDVEMPFATREFSHLTSQAYESGAIGYYFIDHNDHMPTTPIPDAETREQMADEGIELLRKVAAAIDIRKVIEQMGVHENYIQRVFEKYPNAPAAFNQKNK